MGLLIVCGLNKRAIILQQSNKRYHTRTFRKLKFIETTLHLITGGPSSRLEKKPTINSWKRHALCDSVLSYERSPWKFELFVFNAYYINTWIKLYISFLRARKRKILSVCKFSKKLTVWNAPNICVVDHSKTLVFRDVIKIKFFKLRYCTR